MGQTILVPSNANNRAMKPWLQETSRLLFEDEVKILDLCDRDLTQQDIEALAIHLETNSSLKTLNLCSNPNMGQGGLCILACSLIHNAALRNLLLGYHSISPQYQENATASLGIMLQYNSTLQMLCLDHNDMGDEGVINLSRGLRNNTGLQVLNLSFNCISDKGCTELARALETRESLCKLILKHNSIGDDGATALSFMLKSNNSIREMSLPQNPIGKRGLIELMEGLHYNYTFTNLLIDKGSNDDLLQRIRFYEALNQSGRCFLKTENQLENIWPSILTNAARHTEFGLALVYWFLRENPSIWSPK